MGLWFPENQHGVGSLESTNPYENIFFRRIGTS